jgi:methylthioribose-1-phosphate isomerase
MGDRRSHEDLVRSVEWSGDHLAVVDQTRLPGELVIVELRSVDEVVDAISRLVVRGAPAIGVCGAFGMVLGLREHDEEEDVRAVLDHLAERIGSARPTAVNLSWAVRRVVDAARDARSVREAEEAALEEALRIQSEDRESCRRIGEFGRQEVGAARRVFTHCNTGRLATAGLGTALGVVYAMAAGGQAVEVLATETRPLLQGARLTAWELHDAGIPVTLLPDSAAASTMASGGVDVAIVGCDRVARNGDTANKIGTYGHAVLAERHGIPFYVAGPMSSFDPDVDTGADIRIEIRDAEEVRSSGGVRTAPDVETLNPAFDITPAELITAFITDMGVLRPPFDRTIPAALEEAESRGLR